MKDYFEINVNRRNGKSKTRVKKKVRGFFPKVRDGWRRTEETVQGNRTGQHPLKELFRRFCEYRRTTCPYIRQ